MLSIKCAIVGRQLKIYDSDEIKKNTLLIGPCQYFLFVKICLRFAFILLTFYLNRFFFFYFKSFHPMLNYFGVNVTNICIVLHRYTNYYFRLFIFELQTLETIHLSIRSIFAEIHNSG